MNKQELVNAIAERTGESKKTVAAIISATTNIVQAAVAGGDEVQVIGFGTWKRGVVKGGTLPSIATGQSVTYPDTWTVRFSAGDTFKGLVKAGPKPVKTAA